MAKKKKPEMVKIKRNKITKEIPKSQWDAMVKSKQTYGWKLASDLSDDVLKKEKEIEDTKIGELENEVKDLQGLLTQKDTKIGELENEVKAYEVTVENLELKIKELTPSSDDKAAPKADKASAKTGK